VSENERIINHRHFDHDDWIELLNHGVIELKCMPWSSNATFLSLCRLKSAMSGDLLNLSPEKIVVGFSDGSIATSRCLRLSEALRFEIVPETIERTGLPMDKVAPTIRERRLRTALLTLIDEPKHLDRLRSLLDSTCC